MRYKGIRLSGVVFALFLLNSCSALKYGDDPNYSVCKQLEREIQFGGSTSYTPEAQSASVDKRRLQSTYDKMDCSKYQWLKW